MRRASLAALLFAGLIAASPTSAQPTNPGFESGFTGWLLASTNAAFITGAEDGITPTQGLAQAVLYNSSGNVTAMDLEVFLGLPAGNLFALGNGYPTNGNALRQAFTAPAGTIIAFDWNFRTLEPFGECGRYSRCGFNDFAFATFNGALRELADHHSQFVGIETGYRSTCFITTGGVDVIGAGVVNVGDTLSWYSQLFFDNGRAVADGDGDGAGDPCDNCPGLPNPTQADADQDFIGDACDSCFGTGTGADTDGDGVCDGDDNCPNNVNPGQEDGDGDEAGDACDPCRADPSPTDSDGDGFCGVPAQCPAGCDNCPNNANGTQADVDGDGRGDTCDNCPNDANPGQEDGDGDWFGNACDGCVGYGVADGDGDLLCDPFGDCLDVASPLCAELFDNCPDVANPGQEDGDGDGPGDACDPCATDPSPTDSDGDGFCGVPAQCPAGCDNCPFDANGTQADVDGDGRGDICDNCPDLANPTQRDADFDDIGDACDGCFGFSTTDGDGDGRCDDADNCPTIPNPTQQDSDFDGFGNACDRCTGPGPMDSDGDSLCDLADPCVTDPTQACATLFGCTDPSFGPSDLYRLNPTTGVGILVGPLGFSSCTGLEFDADSGVLYAVSTSAFSALSTSGPALFRVDPATANSTLVGPTGGTAISDLAARADGTLWTYLYHHAAILSETTGAASQLFGIVDNTSGGLTFDDAGELYYAAQRVARIDQSTGIGTDLGAVAFPPDICGFPRVAGLATDESGTVHALIDTSCGFFPRYLGPIGLAGGTVSAAVPTVGNLSGIAFAPSGACGDGILNLSEQCDDGNVVGGDCCAPGCTVEAAGAPCSSGDPCAVGRCDGAGSCVGAPPADCRAPGRAQLRLQSDGDTAMKRLRFTWSKGAAVDASELGDPLQTAHYTMCVYAGPARTRIARLTVPAAGGRWSPLPSDGFSYKDATASAAGVTRVRLRPGPTGKSRALLLAKGGNLAVPFFPSLPLPVRVELLSDEAPTCLGATFAAGDVRHNDAGLFTATVK